MKSFLGMYAFENAFSAFKWLRYSPCCNALHTKPTSSQPSERVCVCSFSVLVWRIAGANIWNCVGKCLANAKFSLKSNVISCKCLCWFLLCACVWVGGYHKITSSPLKIPMIFFLCLCIYLPTSAIEPAIKVMKRVATRSPSFPSNRKSTTDSMGMLSSCKISTFTCN